MTNAFGTTLRGRLLLAVVIAFLPVLALEAYLLDAQGRPAPRAGRARVRDLPGERALRGETARAEQQDRANLFQRFFRSSRTQTYGGTGLGLYISRGIAEMHGGRLELEGSDAGGSVFALALRLARPPGVHGDRGGERAPAPS